MLSALTSVDRQRDAGGRRGVSSSSSASSAGYFAVRPVRETMGTILGRDRVANLWLATWIVSLAIVRSTAPSWQRSGAAFFFR
jgi:hypothetical protein